jgi:hypothetical protein
MSDDIRLPLDMLLIHDVEMLEYSLVCKFAMEFESEIYFCKTKSELKDFIREHEDVRWYEIDDIEHDRIRAVMDLLNMAETNQTLGTIIDRLVK